MPRVDSSLLDSKRLPYISQRRQAPSAVPTSKHAYRVGGQAGRDEQQRHAQQQERRKHDKQENRAEEELQSVAGRERRVLPPQVVCSAVQCRH